MSNWKKSLAESKKRWEQNADFWDEKMGEHGNRFHREIIRPDTERLLDIKQNERVLDIGCGNGIFSKRLVELGANVTAFDYSYKMIENAKKRCANYLDKIDFRIIDAAKYEEIMCFDAGFILNGFEEPVFEFNENCSNFDWCDIPPVIIVRLLKNAYV